MKKAIDEVKLNKKQPKIFSSYRINWFNFKYLQQAFAEQAHFISESADLILTELQKLLKFRMFILSWFFQVFKHLFN